jgi:uracil-DNA glycosylase family 4
MSSLELTDSLVNPGPGLDPLFVGPKGCYTDVHLYIAGEGPGKEEVEQGTPFVGPAGQTLDRAIVEAAKTGDIDPTKIRYFNVIPYRPIVREGSRIKDRTPEHHEIQKYSVFLRKDIEKTRPKVILLTGKSAMSAFDIDTSVGAARVHTYSYLDIPVFVTYHPSFVLRVSGWGILTRGTSESFETLIGDLKRAWSGFKKETVSNILKYEVIDVLEWSRVEEIFKNDTEVVLDYEASGLNTYHYNYFVGGLALKGRTTKTCVYVMLYNFWRTPGEFVIPDKLKAKIGVWLLSKKLIVFNLQYECAASLSYFGVYIRDVLDVMMMNRCLGRSGGLKEIASTRLGIQTWDAEVDEWNSLLQKIIKYVKPTYKGRIREEVIFIQDSKCNSIDTLIAWFDAVKKPTDRIVNLRTDFVQINRLAKKYYNRERYTEFCKRFFTLIIQRSTDKDFEDKFTDVPVEIIAPYAIRDIEFTDRLKDHLGEEVQKLGLVRVSEIYNNLGKLGFELEASGIAWNDELATKLDKVYLDTAIDSLRSILMIPRFQKILPSSLSTDQTFVPVIDNTQDVLEIQTTTELDNLTKFFNPRSNHKDTRDRFSKLIVTPRLKFLMMLFTVFKEYQNSKDECFKEYPVLGPTLEQVLAESDSAERFKVVDTLVEASECIGNKVQNHPANSSELWKDDNNIKITPPEIKVFIEFYGWTLPGMASEVIEDIYNAFWHIGGVNVDDKSTWVDEFRIVFLFRLYKKVMKVYSTYIWGDVGRGNATLVDKRNVRALRHPGWTEKTPTDKIWIKETSFGVCTAVTKRFRSGDHTVPAGELIDLRVSRFIDGVRLHWDLSQSEIRVLATIAKDEALLQKFREGADIHLFIASKIWGKPEKQITKQERRYAKSAVFAVLYGDSPPSFAIKFLNGNIQLAKYIFTQLFSTFPNIEIWIKAQHSFLLENGYILTPLGDPIYDVGLPHEALSLSQWSKDQLLENVFSRKVKLSSNREVDKKLRMFISESFRNAQNYPIQNASSVLAGLGIYYMSEYTLDQDMSARIDCFTHDAADLDVQIADLPKIISALPRYVIDKVVEEFNIPIKAEYEIGVSGDQMVELKNAVVDGPIISSEFHESKQTAVEALDSRLSAYGVKTYITVDEEVESVRSMGELFIARGAFALSLGQSRKLVTGKMRLDFSNVQREPYT